MDAKRTKPETAPLVPQSKVLRPFRTVGVVTNGVPSAVSTLGQNYIVSTVVGRSVQIYDAASLRLLFMTQPQAESEIECVCTHFHYVYAVAAGKLLVYRRGQLVAQAPFPVETRQRATKIIVFGGYVCVCVPRSGSGDAAVHIFKTNKDEVEFYTSLATPSLLGNIVDIAHLPTYVNKLVVATQSCLVLFNVKTGKLVHTFSEIPAGISSVEAAPTALDKAAVACTNGDVLVVDLRVDRELFRLETGEPITCLSFRSDVGAEAAAMLGVGTSNGDVFFYSLDLRRRVQSLRGFSTEAISNVSFLPGQPMALVSGKQNRLVELVFDPVVTSKATTQNVQQSVQQRARVLRQRGGHSLPSSSLLFADDEAHFLLSSSLDGSLWAFSLRKDSQSHAFGGQKKIDLPPITTMAYSAEKAERWATLVTAHKGSPDARTWSVTRGALGSLVLTSLDNSLVTSVAVSPCGNFGIVGSASGSIAVYNLQSGLLRMSVPQAHTSAVTGMSLLPNNSVLMSCSLDGTLNFFQFSGTQRTPQKLASVSLNLGAVTDLRFHAGSGLVCVSTDSMALVVVDTKTYKVVRELWGHGNRITSFDFIPSGRWIVSASLDQTIRTWDVPTGACIDGVKVSNVVTHLRVSKNSEWVATAHVRGVGVQMWSLQTLGHTNLRNITEDDIVDIDMPTVSGENGVSLLEGLIGDQIESDEDQFEIVDSNKSQLQPGLVTLSGQPPSKFTTLIHLDAIRERNKPIEGPKKPEKQPFFLGVPGESNGPNADENAETGRITSGELSHVSGEHVSPFTHFLAVGKFEELAQHLTELGPAATDLEIRSIDTDAPYAELIAFIDCMSAQLEAGKRFELVQAWMSMLLQSHADIFAEPVTEQLQKSFERWLATQKRKVAEMQESTRFCSGVLAYLRH